MWLDLCVCVLCVCVSWKGGRIKLFLAMISPHQIHKKTGCQVSTRTFSSFPACESSDGRKNAQQGGHRWTILTPVWASGIAKLAHKFCLPGQWPMHNIHKLLPFWRNIPPPICHSTPHNPIFISNSPQKPWFSTLSLYSFGIGWRLRQLPIGSMYGIYGNIYHQYTPNVSIYTSTMDPMGYGIWSRDPLAKLGGLTTTNSRRALRLRPLSRAAATAWLAPLPPGTMTPVSGPCEGRWSKRFTGSMDWVCWENLQETMVFTCFYHQI